MSHDFLFYIERDGVVSGDLRLDGDEHHHLARVVRMRPGDTAFVTDGAGTILECEITEVAREYSRLRAVRTLERPAPVRPPVLALGCIKRERFERAVAYGTELGMERCIPVLSRNGARTQYNDRFLERLRTIALAAMKQSFRAVLPRIDPPIRVEELVEQCGGFDTVIVGSQEAPALVLPPAAGRVMVIVGPEAGFTAEEQQALAGAGAIAASVSSARLRSETAAIAMLSLVNSPAPAGQSD